MIDKYIDRYILFYIGLLGAISCVFIYTSTEVFAQYAGSFVVKQILFYIIGFVLMIGIALLQVEHLKKFAWIFYVLIVLLLIGLIFAPENIARPINEAKAWYQVKYIGTFQPSEFLKFAFVLVVAKMIDKRYTTITQKSFVSDCILLSKIVIVTIPPMLLVYKREPLGE